MFHLVVAQSPPFGTVDTGTRQVLRKSQNHPTRYSEILVIHVDERKTV